MRKRTFAFVSAGTWMEICPCIEVNERGCLSVSALIPTLISPFIVSTSAPPEMSSSFTSPLIVRTSTSPEIPEQSNSPWVEFATMTLVVRGTVISKSAEPPVQPSDPYSRTATLSFSESVKPAEAERTRRPSLRGVGPGLRGLGLHREPASRHSQWTVMSPWNTRIFSVPGFVGSEKAIWLVASSARAERRGTSATAAARRRVGSVRVVFPGCFCFESVGSGAGSIARRAESRTSASALSSGDQLAQLGRGLPARAATRKSIMETWSSGFVSLGRQARTPARTTSWSAWE